MELYHGIVIASFIGYDLAAQDAGSNFVPKANPCNQENPVSHVTAISPLERFSCDSLKIVPVSVRYLFYQPMDEKIKTWPLRFPAKENRNM